MTSQQSPSRASAANQKAGGVANQLLTNAVPTAEMRPRLQQRPYFDLPAGNVSCVVGQTVTLLCRVRHVGDRTERITTSQTDYSGSFHSFFVLAFLLPGERSEPDG
ncbi:uncharacterized protein LOC120352969 [Nilaparvata lugens]|uniref:uncharacterized protein LOC120352969 n=1 Tax=Nilaparvata lugens TaxID=108931 RepID=UPI00193E8FCD|nr:uncharacterized protein LOC120352969 [Nilaparvata lugens]